MMKTANFGVFQPSLEITKVLKQRRGSMNPEQLKKLDATISKEVLLTLFLLLPELEYMIGDSGRTDATEAIKASSQRATTTEKALQWWQRNEWFNAQGFEQETAAARAFDVLIDLEGYDKDSDEYFSILNTRLQNFFSEGRIQKQIKYHA
jgi:hypothetical protein